MTGEKVPRGSVFPFLAPSGRSAANPLWEKGSANPGTASLTGYTTTPSLIFTDFFFYWHKTCESSPRKQSKVNQMNCALLSNDNATQSGTRSVGEGAQCHCSLSSKLRFAPYLKPQTNHESPDSTREN